MSKTTSDEINPPKNANGTERMEPTANLLVVLGMHRSGTSALAGLLHAAGASVATDLLDEQPEINQMGFWEDSAIVSLNDRLLAEQQLRWFDYRAPSESALITAAAGGLGEEARAHLTRHYAEHEISVCKDPRFCQTLPFWKRCFDQVGLRPLYLLCLRQPAEVAASLSKRDALPPVYGSLLWMRYSLSALEALSEESFAPVNYTEILESPGAVVRRVAEAAGAASSLKPNPSDIEGAVDSKLRHHLDLDPALPLPALQVRVESLYRALHERPGEIPRRLLEEISHYLAENDSIWALTAGLAVNAMRDSGELVAIGEKHRTALDVIGAKDRDIAHLTRLHDTALETIAQKDQDAARLARLHDDALETIASKDQDITLKNQEIARLGMLHGTALETITERDDQLRNEVAWREHLEVELRKWQAALDQNQAEFRKCQSELQELNEGLLALPVRLRRKARNWSRRDR